jgi:hypothetical protein
MKEPSPSSSRTCGFPTSNVVDHIYALWFAEALKECCQYRRDVRLAVEYKPKRA